MSIHQIEVPSPPNWSVEWDRVLSACPWLAPLADCPQNPAYHGEGDVLTHTRMVVDALVSLDEWRTLDSSLRRTMFLAALLHDVAKPECTRQDIDGTLISPGHSKRGSIRARGILWRDALEFTERELIAGLIRHHQVPFNAIDMERLAGQRRVVIASVNARCDLLALLARADAMGRISRNVPRMLENVELFRELCRENDCLTAPRRFPTDHARFLYFRQEGRSLDAPGFESYRGEVIVMSGIPGSGKDRWIAENAGGLPVVSLDDIREELDLKPGESTGEVINAAREAAREHMRGGEAFVWNATNVSRELRGMCIRLFADYDYRIRIAYIESPAAKLFELNENRSRPVPRSVLDRLIGKWEVPDLTEAHSVSIGPLCD